MLYEVRKANETELQCVILKCHNSRKFIVYIRIWGRKSGRLYVLLGFNWHDYWNENIDPPLFLTLHFVDVQKWAIPIANVQKWAMSMAKAIGLYPLMMCSLKQLKMWLLLTIYIGYLHKQLAQSIATRW